MQNRTRRDGDVDMSVKSTPKNKAVTVIDLSSEEGGEAGGSSPEGGEKEIARPKNVPKAEEINEMFS